MPKIKVIPVFYNMLIKTFESIENEVKKKDYTTALLSTFALIKSLELTEWQSFPDYQCLKEKLLLPATKIFARDLYLLNSESNEIDKSVLKQKVNDYIKLLSSISHLFNFLETTYNENNSVKSAAGLFSRYTAGFDVTESDRYLRGCHGHRIWQKINSSSHLANFKYSLIMQFINVCNHSTLINLVEVLFSSLDKIDYNAYDYLDVDKEGLFSPKCERLNQLFEWVNEYKSEYEEQFDTNMEESDEFEANNSSFSR